VTDHTNAIRSALLRRGLLRTAARAAEEAGAILDDVLGDNADAAIAAARRRVCAVLGVTVLDELLVEPAPREGCSVRLSVIAVESLTSRSDRFRCVPMSATITAGSCLDRQKVSQIKHAGTVGKLAMRARTAGNGCAGCSGCELGQRVAAQMAKIVGEAA